VGWAPAYWTARGHPIVIFQPVGAGFIVTPVHSVPGTAKRCAKLHVQTSFNAKTPGARVLKFNGP
jgi:hypothetical protein